MKLEKTQQQGKNQSLWSIKGCFQVIIPDLGILKKSPQTPSSFLIPPFLEIKELQEFACNYFTIPLKS